MLMKFDTLSLEYVSSSRYWWKHISHNELQGLHRGKRLRKSNTRSKRRFRFMCVGFPHWKRINVVYYTNMQIILCINNWTICRLDNKRHIADVTFDEVQEDMMNAYHKLRQNIDRTRMKDCVTLHNVDMGVDQ